LSARQSTISNRIVSLFTDAGGHKMQLFVNTLWTNVSINR